jgi:hypothetical protein
LSLEGWGRFGKAGVGQAMQVGSDKNCQVLTWGGGIFGF